MKGIYTKFNLGVKHYRDSKLRDRGGETGSTPLRYRFFPSLLKNNDRTSGKITRKTQVVFKFIFQANFYRYFEIVVESIFITG